MTNGNPLSNNNDDKSQLDDLISGASASGERIKINSEETEAKLQEKMVEMKENKKENRTRQAAEQDGFNYIYLKGFPIVPEALILMTEEEAKRLQAVCFFYSDKDFRIGAVKPDSPEIRKLVDKFEEELQSRGDIYQISDKSLEEALKLYSVIPKPKKYEGGVEITEADLSRFQKDIKSFRDLERMVRHASITDLVALILASAIQGNASDVHIEAEQQGVKIRFRIDGFLYDVAALPKELWPKIVSRIKLVAKLKINISDIPQDGRFTIYLTDEYIDVRVSTVPSAYGESIVMRLLMSSTTTFDLDDLGLVGEAKEILEKQIRRPNGMILNTGPTGSGKTTTLYAILKKLNKSETKIITLENPIEYHLDGITQSQVETSDLAAGEGGSEADIVAILAGGTGKKRHYTYAFGLKSVLRQDPDIIMVGEIRDKETVETAIQASLTGHLLLSTLHTNSAAGAVPRLLSMEAKPFLLAPALNLVIGQRLVRVLCERCQVEYTPSVEVMEYVHQVIDSLPDDKKQGINIENLKFKKGRGCDACNQIGFKGRIGIFEMLAMGDDIQKLILAGQISESQIQNAAKKNGMLTMVQDGILKALQGLTTPEEIFRVIS